MTIAPKYKFIATVAFIFLLPFLILSSHFVRGSRELAKRDSLYFMELRVRSAAHITAGQFALFYDLSGLCSSEEFTTASAEGKKKRLERKIKENPGIYSGFSVLSASGRVLLSAGQPAFGGTADCSGEELFKRAAAARSPSGAVEYGAYTPPALVLVAPLRRPGGGETGGFLAARLSLAYIGELVRLMGRKASGSMGLMDAGGQVISDSLGRSIMEPGVKAPDEVRLAASGAAIRGSDNISREVSVKGRPAFLSASKVGGTQWWIFELADASRPMHRSSEAWVRQVVLTGVLLILIFSFVSYKLALFWLVPKKGGPGAGPGCFV